MTKLQEIRQEYGSFRNAVKHYADMGCSRKLTAEYLNINRMTLHSKIKQYDLNDLFRPLHKMAQQCRAGNPYLADINRARSMPDEVILAEVARYRDAAEFKRLSKVSYATLWRRFGGWEKAKSLLIER